MIYKPAQSIKAHKAHNTVPRKALIKVGELKSNIQTINHAWLEPGEGFEPHQHPDCEEVYYFLKGSGVMRIDEKELEVSEGDVVVVEVNEAHGLRNEEEMALEFMTVRALVE